MNTVCSEVDCEKKARARALCNMHYTRFLRHGSPTVNLTWKGDDIGYTGAHARVRYRRGPASEHTCLHCGERARDWALSHDTPCHRLRTGTVAGREVVFSPDPGAYMPLCGSCHVRYDRDLQAVA
jgi:hypothetical protein